LNRLGGNAPKQSQATLFLSRSPVGKANRIIENIVFDLVLLVNYSFYCGEWIMAARVLLPLPLSTTKKLTFTAAILS
jgi:hypothetical protein